MRRAAVALAALAAEAAVLYLVGWAYPQLQGWPPPYPLVPGLMA